MEESLRRLGVRIKSLREKRGMSQERFAELCGLGRNAISAIEGGKSAAKISTLWAIANCLGTTVQKLLNGIDPFNST